MAVVYEDTRQQKDKHTTKHRWFAAHGIELVPLAMTAKANADDPNVPPSGDYWREGSNVTVDTKASIAEIAANLSTGHKRFRAECERARDAGFRLVVLVESARCREINDVCKWVNSHCVRCGIRLRGGCNPRDLKTNCKRHGKRKPIQGHTLAASMKTMEKRYGVRFEFCDPKESAARICELLGVTEDE